MSRQPGQRLARPVYGTAASENQANIVKSPDTPIASVSSIGRGRAVTAGIIKMIDYLETVLVEETELLQSRAPIDLRGFNEKKSRGLLDLSKALGTFKNGNVDDTIRARMEGLQGRLQQNREILKLHMEAVRQIAEIISKSTLETESDGTYTRQMRKTEPMP